MILSQKNICATKFGELRAIELIAKAGFDAIDYSMSDFVKDGNVVDSDNYKAYVNELCEAAKRNNIIFNQGHAVTGVDIDDPEIAYKVLAEKNIRCLEIAGLMGMKTLVVHPYGTGIYIGREEEALERNMKYFNILLPYAEKYGIKIACENIQSALNYCSQHPQTKLVIDKGTYYFRSVNGLDANNCTDLLIEGSDATFAFSSTGYKFFIRNSDCVEIRNLNFDWNWAESPLASVVTVQNSNPDTKTVDLVFRNPEYCNENNSLTAIIQCDPETYTFGAEYSSKEVYLYQDGTNIKSVQKISANTLRVTHNGCMDNFKNGET